MRWVWNLYLWQVTVVDFQVCQTDPEHFQGPKRLSTSRTSPGGYMPSFLSSTHHPPLGLTLKEGLWRKEWPGEKATLAGPGTVSKVRSPAWSSDGSPPDLPAPTSWCSPTLLPGTRAWAGVPVNRSQPLSPGCSFSRLLFPYPPLSLHLDL